MVVEPKLAKIPAKMASLETPGAHWNRKRIRKNAIFKIALVYSSYLFWKDVISLLHFLEICCFTLRFSDCSVY